MFWPSGGSGGTFCFGVGVRAACFTRFRAAAAWLAGVRGAAAVAACLDDGVFSAVAAAASFVGGSSSRKDSTIIQGGSISIDDSIIQRGSSSSKFSEANSSSPDSNSKAKSTPFATRWPANFFLQPLGYVVRSC